MKKNIFTMVVCLSFWVANNLFAQNTCCSGTTVAPELTPGFYGSPVPMNQNTPAPVLSVLASSDLPNTEYVITKRGTAALDASGQVSTVGGGGDVIVGADADGIFMPMNKSRYGIGLSNGDMFDLTAVGYDLQVIKILTDSLLNGMSGVQPCCGLFVVMAVVLGEPALAGFCDSVNSAGIYSANDVNSLEDVLVVMEALSPGQQSVNSLLYSLQTLNSNGAFISTDCGGTGANNYVPYGIDPTKQYGYQVMGGPAPSVSNTCCLSTTVAPEITLGMYAPLIPMNQNTPAPVLAVLASSDLPNTEYVITKRGTPALNALGVPDTTGGGGDVIVGADADGIFMPMNKSRYGVSLATGDTFDLTAVGYDLQLMRALTDSLINGVTPTGQCCQLFAIMAAVIGDPAIAGFCDSVNNAGIYSSNDVNNLEDILVVIDAFSPGQKSVASLISTLQLINQYGTFISADCGGAGAVNFLPYGVTRSERYSYVIDNALLVQELSNVSKFVMFPNPATHDIQIKFTTKEQVDLNVNIYTVLGESVVSKNLGFVHGDYTRTISLEGLSSGMYWVELTDGHNRATQKLVVR